MSELSTKNKLARLWVYAKGFGFRRITDGSGRVYFAHNGAIYATGYDFTERDNRLDYDGVNRLPRPHIGGLPTGFDEIFRVERVWFIDRSFEYIGTQHADDAPLDGVLMVYEAAFVALPWWRKASVLLHALIP